MKQGVVVVAAEGNQADDLPIPTQDATSPDDTTPVLRDDHTTPARSCPSRCPAWSASRANGNLGLKSFYSSYGVGTADVVGSGRRLDPAADGGRTERPRPLDVARLAADRHLPAGTRVVDASRRDVLLPAGHLDGLAARRRRRGADREPRGDQPGAVEAGSKTPPTRSRCPPDMSIYAFFPAVDNGAPQNCQGGTGSNSFNGKGQINALTAVGG